MSSALSLQFKQDDWALKYIDIMRSQQLIEAIDADLSSFITIREINEFTSAKPPEWT